MVLDKLSAASRTALKRIWADGGYRGQLVDWVHEHLDAVLQVVERDPALKYFQVLPRRWVVERTFAWFGRYRRLSAERWEVTERAVRKWIVAGSFPNAYKIGLGKGSHYRVPVEDVLAFESARRVLPD